VGLGTSQEAKKRGPSRDSRRASPETKTPSKSTTKSARRLRQRGSIGLVIVGGWPRRKRSLHVWGVAVVAAPPPPRAAPLSALSLNTVQHPRTHTSGFMCSIAQNTTKRTKVLPMRYF
jgi:hypothetical protein